MRIKIALVDDHQLVRSGIKKIIDDFANYYVVLEGNNGNDFLKKLSAAPIKPNIVLMDLSMPIMNGIETTQYLTKHYPEIKTIALSVHDDIKSINAMIKAGARAYLAKDSSPELLEETINTVFKVGYYYDRFLVKNFVKKDWQENEVDEKFHLHEPKNKNLLVQLSAREIQLLQLLCSEFTMKEIAEKMGIAYNTANSYRDNVASKIGITNRIGMVMYAINNGFYKPKINDD